MRFFLYTLVIASIAACTQPAEPNVVEDLPEHVKSYGAVIEAQEAISYAELAKQTEALAENDSLDCYFKGQIIETCSKKGCWMTVDAGGDDELFVKFKDYDFFVPVEGQGGHETLMRGKAFKTVTSVDELRHYAEDAGKSEEEIAAITEPEEGIGFIADGVLIYED